MAIKFINQTPLKLLNKRALKEKLGSIFFYENKSLKSLTYIICDDTFLLDLNKLYLNHDSLTDVLTFDLSERQNLLVAEIYISIERIKENSIEYNVLFYNELYRVMIHGVLHLCGFKDKTSMQKQTMRKKEDWYLKLLF